MKRAEVFYNHWGDHAINGRWLVATHKGDIPSRHLPLVQRMPEEDQGFPTHAAALAHALVEVGLVARGKIFRKHADCAACDRMAREAERTAHKHGTDHWSSYDTLPDGTTHAAHYLDASALAASPEDREEP